MLRTELDGLLERLLLTLSKWALITLDELRCGLTFQRLIGSASTTPHRFW
jgi:hypothetical protein